jgi:hypothetical protein
VEIFEKKKKTIDVRTTENSFDLNGGGGGSIRPNNQTNELIFMFRHLSLSLHTAQYLFIYFGPAFLVGVLEFFT